MPQRPLEARRAVAPARAKQPDVSLLQRVRVRDATDADVPALVTRDGNRFSIFFAQEYGDSVVATVRDAQDGIR